MQSNQKNLFLNTNCPEQTPDMLISRPDIDPLYELVFLSHGETSGSEWSQNTTAWD